MILASVLFFLIIAGLVIQSRKDAKMISGLFRQIEVLQEDNRRLMECIARENNKPLIFKQPEPEESEEWFARVESKPPEPPPIRQY